MAKSIEEITHEELFAWRRDGNTEILPEHLKERLEQYFTIHRLYIDSTPKRQIFKILSQTYQLSLRQFDYIFPLAIRFFNSEVKLTEDDFIHIQYEKFNKVIKALWLAGDLQGYSEAVEKQTKTCRPKVNAEGINIEDLKQHIFILSTNPRDFGFTDIPSQKEILQKILSLKKTHDISDYDVKNIAADAGIEYTDYDEIINKIKEDD